MITLEGIDPGMIANNIEPSEPIHPGELLKEEIKYRKISQKQLAALIGISYTVLNQILNCKRDITTEYALLFEAALGIEAHIWINTQSDYNIQILKQNKSFVDRLEHIRKVVASML